MNIDRLIKMANQIGTFFETERSSDDAAVEITAHLRKFWDPRMRLQLVQYVETQGGDDLLPIVRRSICANMEELISGVQRH